MLKKKQQDQILFSSEEEKYFNDPSELISYAGDVAQILFFKLRDHPEIFKSSWVEQQLKESKIYQNILPKNKKVFLIRVYKEIERLINSNLK